MIMQHVLEMQALAHYGEQKSILIFNICFDSMNMSNYRSLSFIDRLLLGSFTEKWFKQGTHVCHNKFKFLCGKYFLLSLYL